MILHSTIHARTEQLKRIHMANLAVRWTGFISLLFMVFMQAAVNGDYELEVEFFRFDNPNQRCEECNLSNATTVSGGCCDNNSTAGEECSSRQCDMYFTFCHERSLNTPSDSRGCPGMEINRMNNSIQNTDGVSFRDAVFGIRMNPVIFRGYQWVGTQFYIEFKDRDFDEDDPDDLIDTLAIDIDIPVGASMNHTTYTGRFNNAQVELSFRVACAENYYGPDCTQCNSSFCSCDPGFTGEFCQTNIDDCEGVNCSGHGQCEDQINSFSCLCDPGFTGEFCQIDIDDCEGANCSGNGQCMDGIDSFSCLCDPRYTGELCERDIDFCAGINCSGHGNCTNDNLPSYSCECEPGYTGTGCEFEIDNCVGVDCGQNGLCLETGNSYECICTEGFSGENCTKDSESSSSGPTETEPSSGGPTQGTESSSSGPTQGTKPSSIHPTQETEPSSIRPTEETEPSSSGPTQGTEPNSIRPTQETESSSIRPTQKTEPSSSGPTEETESSQPKTSTPLGVIIGGAVGGALVLTLIIILLVLLIIVCVLRRNIKRMHYNVEDVLKSQSITPGDNPVYEANPDDKRKIGEEQRERELNNPIYDGFTENGAEYETTTFTSPTEARKFDNPIYEGALQSDQKRALETSAPNLESIPRKPETGPNLNGIAPTTSHREVVDHTNPILCSVEEREDEMAGKANPLFTQTYEKGGTSPESTSPESSCEESKQELAASSSLTKSSIYDDDFLKPEDETQTGNEDLKKEQQPHSNSFSKHSYRRQDYEDIA